MEVKKAMVKKSAFFSGIAKFGKWSAGKKKKGKKISGLSKAELALIRKRRLGSKKPGYPLSEQVRFFRLTKLQRRKKTVYD